MTYYPEPEFSNFTTNRVGDSVDVTIQVWLLLAHMYSLLGDGNKWRMTFVSLFQKKADKLDMSPRELSVWAVQGGTEYKCEMRKKETSNETDFFTCKIKQPLEASFQKLKVIPHFTSSPLAKIVETHIIKKCCVFSFPVDNVWKKDGASDARVLIPLIHSDAALSCANTLHRHLYVWQHWDILQVKGHGWSYCMITWQPFVSPSGGPDLSSQTEDARWSDEQAHGRPGAGHQEWHQTRSVRVLHNRLNDKWAALGTWYRRTESKHLEMFQRKKKTWGAVWDKNEFPGYVYSTADLCQGLR